jgi:nucleotide-binding universal stress UspA family protein
LSQRCAAARFDPRQGPPLPAGFDLRQGEAPGGLQALAPEPSAKGIGTMSFKTLFTAVTAGAEGDGKGRIAVFDAAVALARRWDAHLDVVAFGIDRTQIGYYYAGASAMIYQQTIERAQQEAAAMEKATRERLTREDIRWSVEATVVQIGNIGSIVAERARFADIAVLPKPYGPGRGVENEAVTEAALFEAAVPVLVLPEDTPPRFDRIVVAWNQGAEALAAVRAALPLLVGAGMVNIVVIDPPPHGPERSDPGGQLSAWLSRHGVRSEVSVLARTMPRTSDVLARHVRDTGADFLVMGAYGHSRFRQAILGGTTRNTLEQATVPVLMAR